MSILSVRYEHSIRYEHSVRPCVEYVSGHDNHCFLMDRHGPLPKHPDKLHTRFIFSDFQQIELRLLAHLADDPVLLKLFNDKEIPDIFNALTAQW